MNQTNEDYFIFIVKMDSVTHQYIKEHPINANLLPYTMQRELNRGAFIMNRTNDY